MFSLFTIYINNYIYYEIFNKIVEENPQELYNKIVKINNHQREFAYMLPFIFFEYCFEVDILDETISPEEKEFMERIKNPVHKDEEYIISHGKWYMKKIISRFDYSGDENTVNRHKTYDESYDEYLKKYMIPCLELPNV